MNLLLIRDVHRLECTLGILTVDGRSWQTIERGWVPDTDGGVGGKPGVSCVPTGLYQLVRHDTPKHPNTWALVNHDLDIYADPTPRKRSDVLLHSANWAFQLEGCIAPGKERVWDGKAWLVSDSKQAMNEIRGTVPWTAGHTMEIR